MKAVQVVEPGADFELVELPIPDVSPDEVRVKVEACGVCHSDAFVKEGQFPGIDYPRTPGHEVIGVIDAVGSDVTGWEAGERVGVGWHGGHCFECDACREGDFILCENAQITGIHFDGGYAEYMTAPSSALASVPGGLDSIEAAPLLCAGITVYNALRNSDARPGDLVAVQGIGGLGHLALQYADAMGFEAVAISRSPDKEELAFEMGATHFVNADDAAERLQEMGGAKVILATAPNSEAISALIPGLGRNGELIVVAASGEAIQVSPMALIGGRRKVSGWASGDARDSEDTLNFSELTHSIPEVETFPLADAAKAYAAMINNEVRFRAVIVMD